jgi:hypothetical protein
MKIREGAYYRTRGGQVFGPTQRNVTGDGFKYYKEDGSFVGAARVMDLISEVWAYDTPPSDEPAITAATIRSLAAERDALMANLDAIVIPTTYYMDPPDGGDVSIAEQVSRMYRHVCDLQAENARLREALRPFIHTGNMQVGYRVGQNPPPPTASEEEARVHYSSSEFHYQQWLQWRAVQIGKELLGEKE